MYNILIAEDNLMQSYTLINDIFKEIMNIRLCNISITKKETINMIKTEMAYVILLDFNCKERISVIDIITFIDNNHLIKYKNSIIIYTNDDYIYYNLLDNPYVYSCVLKNSRSDIIINNIKKLLIEKIQIQDNQKIIDNIKIELKKLNFDFSYIGTKYLLEFIFEIYLSNNYDNINLNHNVYPSLAKKYNKSINNIKCNITQSYIRMFCNCSQEYLENYLNIYIGLKKPKIKDLILKILKNINSLN